MSSLLVAYDLNRPGQQHVKLLEAIKSYPWAKLSESSYAIATYENATSVFNKLRSLLDSNDTLHVVRLNSEHQSWTTQDVHNWLGQNL